MGQKRRKGLAQLRKILYRRGPVLMALTCQVHIVSSATSASASYFYTLRYCGVLVLSYSYIQALPSCQINPLSKRI